MMTSARQRVCLRIKEDVHLSTIQKLLIKKEKNEGKNEKKLKN
tara:strand:- start:69 stop:197 length:129 start_codon:yes stop_codon:yes gene_type:complete